MKSLFLNILNTSITASIIILFILALRFIFRKSTKKFPYILWLILLIRLIVPFSLETEFNPMPDKFMKFTNKSYIENMEEKRETITNLEIDKEEINNPNKEIVGGVPTKPDKSKTNEKEFSIKNSLPYIWAVGILIFLIKGIISNKKLKDQLKASNYLYENIYENKNLNTAFIHGIINPKIYIPNYLNQKEREYIIIHEKTHLKRYDHIIKFLYYIVLSIHWFNPPNLVSFYFNGQGYGTIL